MRIHPAILRLQDQIHGAVQPILETEYRRLFVEKWLQVCLDLSPNLRYQLNTWLRHQKNISTQAASTHEYHSLQLTLSDQRDSSLAQGELHDLINSISNEGFVSLPHYLDEPTLLTQKNYQQACYALHNHHLSPIYHWMVYEYMKANDQDTSIELVDFASACGFTGANFRQVIQGRNINLLKMMLLVDMIYLYDDALAYAKLAQLLARGNVRCDNFMHYFKDYLPPHLTGFDSTSSKLLPGLLALLALGRSSCPGNHRDSLIQHVINALQEGDSVLLYIIQQANNQRYALIHYRIQQFSNSLEMPKLFTNPTYVITTMLDVLVTPLPRTTAASPPNHDEAAE